MRVTPKNILWFGALAARAALADAEGWFRGLPGHRFGTYGRAIGVRLLMAGDLFSGAALLLTPVNSVRYWEFDFVERHLPRRGDQALDVSSPRMLSLYLAHRRRFGRVAVMNPDQDDLAETQRLARLCGLDRVETHAGVAADLATSEARYSAVWSVSVVEHIPGEDGDSVAARAMFQALRPGGVLVITVPTDRRSWNDYRDTDVYGLGLPEQADGTYFFQRYYDTKSIRQRIIDAIGCEPTVVEWFGERRRGTFARYEQEWMRAGAPATVRDPAFIAREFQPYASWDEMPGMGVCGLVFVAPVSPTRASAPTQIAEEGGGT